MTPNEIAAYLIQLGRRLDSLVKEYKELGEASADTKRAYEIAHARAYLNTTGTVEVRRQEALLQTADERFAADLAERRVAACKEAIKAVHARIDVGRTLSATTRDEAKLAGVGT